MGKTQLALRFENFSTIECKGSSELYEFLSIKVSEDNEILELCKEAREGQPVPNLLFGAVHYLLLKGMNHPVKQYYPSIVGNYRKVEEQAFISFKEFCNIYKEEIILILKTKLVQTNEVRRCSYLYPIISLIYSKVKKPLSLVEIGTSAGLQLLWDKYSYSYGTDEIYGDKNSSVHITSDVKGGKIPEMLPEAPPVSSKIGLDLHVNDLRDVEDYLWLKALIWPEHRERLELFEKAAECYKENPVELIEGDGVNLLTEVLETLSEDTAICVFHTHVANQLPEDLKHTLIETIEETGNGKDVFHIYNNIWDRKLHLDYFIDGVEHNEIIGDTDGHGRWFEWALQ